MPKEKESYRDNLEMILRFLKDKYGDNRVMLRNVDVQEFTGRAYNYVRKNYMQGEHFISAAVLARVIS